MIQERPFETEPYVLHNIREDFYVYFHPKVNKYKVPNQRQKRKSFRQQKRRKKC